MAGVYRPLKDIRKERGEALRESLRPQVECALRVLRTQGLVVTPIGSFAKPDAYFDPHSDIDLLVEDAAGRSDLEIWSMARAWIKDVEVDVVMADAVDAQVLEFMKVGVTNE